jgi:hypothetical protein
MEVSQLEIVPLFLLIDPDKITHVSYLFRPSCLLIAHAVCFRRITRNDLADYVKTHYKSPRIVLAAAGGVNHSELVNAAEKHFSGLKSTYEGEIPILQPCRFTGQSFKFLILELLLVLGFHLDPLLMVNHLLVLCTMFIEQWCQCFRSTCCKMNRKGSQSSPVLSSGRSPKCLSDVTLLNCFIWTVVK